MQLKKTVKNRKPKLFGKRQELEKLKTRLIAYKKIQKEYSEQQKLEKELQKKKKKHLQN